MAVEIVGSVIASDCNTVTAICPEVPNDDNDDPIEFKPVPTDCIPSACPAILPIASATAPKFDTSSERLYLRICDTPSAILSNPLPALSAALPSESNTPDNPSRTVLIALPVDSITSPTPLNADSIPLPTDSNTSPTPSRADLIAVPTDSTIVLTPSRADLTAVPIDSTTVPTPCRARLTPIPNPTNACPRPARTDCIAEPTAEITEAIPLNTADMMPAMALSDPTIANAID